MRTVSLFFRGAERVAGRRRARSMAAAGRGMSVRASSARGFGALGMLYNMSERAICEIF